MFVSTVDTDAQSYASRTVDAVLCSAEQEKKRKCLAAVEDRRASFTPFVVSVDGVLGHDAQHLIKHLCDQIAMKWEKSHSEVMVWFVSDILRATNLCLRGSRVKWRCGHGMDDGAGLPHFPWCGFISVNLTELFLSISVCVFNCVFIYLLAVIYYHINSSSFQYASHGARIVIPLGVLVWRAKGAVRRRRRLVHEANWGWTGSIFLIVPIMCNEECLDSTAGAIWPRIRRWRRRALRASYPKA